MDLVNIITEIYKTLNNIDSNTYDTIPSNFDFENNKYAIKYDIASSITDLEDVNEIPLTIRLVGLQKNKIDILNKVNTIDKQINNKDFENCWIVRSNPYITTYNDNDFFNCVLIYYINCYKEN